MSNGGGKPTDVDVLIGVVAFGKGTWPTHRTWQEGIRRMNTLTSFLLYNVLLAAPLANPHWKPKGREPIVVAHVQSPRAQGMVKMGEESICRRK